MTSNGSGPEASEIKNERWWSRWKWARWLAVAILVGGVIYLLAWYVPVVLVGRTRDDTVKSAYISADAALLGVVATAAVAIFAFWYARLTIKDQGEQLDKTLAEQRARTLNERFATAAGQLGSDKPAAVRLAGVYAMAGLADDWPKNRQTCVDVLCGYLRLPAEIRERTKAYDSDPAAEQAAYLANREVRHTVIRVIAAHLQKDAAVSWQGLNFDFSGAVFDFGDFSGVRFVGGEVSFSGARFSGDVSFLNATFSRTTVFFTYAKFSGGTVYFQGARFSGRMVSFQGAKFSGGDVNFEGARFWDGDVAFTAAEFSGGRVSFRNAEFSGGTVYFKDARFSGGKVRFDYATFSGGKAGKVSFTGAEFSRGAVSFEAARFFSGEVDFSRAVFSGAEVDFSRVDDWSVPPAFPWTDRPPPGVKLPRKEDRSQE